MFMLNHRYMVEILIYCLSCNFLLYMFCLFVFHLHNQPEVAGGCEWNAGWFLAETLVLVTHSTAPLPIPISAFLKSSMRLLVHMQGPFTAVAWLLGGEREYSLSPQNTLVPAVLSASPALWLLRGTHQVGELTNFCCPSLLLCCHTLWYRCVCLCL